MEQIVKDILKIVTKHQIHSDSYDCEELESELLSLLQKNKDVEINELRDYKKWFFEEQKRADDLRMELESLKRKDDFQIDGLVTKDITTSTGIRLLTVVNKGEQKQYVNNKEVADIRYKHPSRLPELLEVTFLSETINADTIGRVGQIIEWNFNDDDTHPLSGKIYKAKIAMVDDREGLYGVYASYGQDYIPFEKAKIIKHI